MVAARAGWERACPRSSPRGSDLGCGSSTSDTPQVHPCRLVARHPTAMDGVSAGFAGAKTGLARDGPPACSRTPDPCSGAVRGQARSHPARAAPRTVPRVPLCWGEGLSVALRCMRMALVLAGFCDPEQPAEFERRSGRRHRDRQSPGRRLASPHGWVHGVSRCRLPDRLLQIQPLFNVHKTPPMPQPIPRRSSRSDVRLSPAGLFLIMAPLTKPLSPTPGPPK